MEQLAKTKRPAALGFIFITLLVDVTGLGIIIPVFPKLIEHLAHVDVSTAALYGGYLTIAYAAMQFLFSPLIGSLSDQYGRRPVLLASLLGFGVDYLFLAFAPTFGWLFVGRIIAGITGASFTTATAYISDISTDENRAQNFGLVGAAFGIGFIVGPVLGGVLGHYSTQLPFLAASALALLNALYGYFILPESLPKEKRRAFDIKRSNPVGSLIQLNKYPAVMGLVASYVLIYLAAQAVQSVWTYYTMQKFGWNEAWVGYSLGFVGLMIGLVQGLLIRVAIPKLGKQKSVIIGLLLYTVGLVCFSLASKGWMMFAFCIPYCTGGIAGPAIQGLITAQVPANAQGELQGSLMSLVSLTSIIGPGIMTGMFAYFTGKYAPFQFPGAPFMLGAVFMLLSAVFAARNFKKETA